MTVIESFIVKQQSLWKPSHCVTIKATTFIQSNTTYISFKFYSSSSEILKLYHL